MEFIKMIQKYFSPNSLIVIKTRNKPGIPKNRSLWKHCDSQTKKNLLLGTLITNTTLSVSYNFKTSQTENEKGR